VERAGGRALPLSVRMPCGVALTIGVLDLFTRSTSTVSAAIPAVCALAAGGLVLRPPWRWRRLDRALVAPAVVFAVYGAPIVLSGSATWAGYVKLDDTATWLALVDRTLTAGHTLAGLPTSTYTDTLAAYLTNGYPVGSFLPLGLGHALLAQDIAWLTDPWMAFAAAMLAMSLYRIAARALGSGAPRWQAPAIAVISAQPALLYGYYLWGGMKEMTGAMLVAAFASVAPLAWEGRRRARALIPALVVVWATLSALSAGGLVWLAPGAVLALLALAPRRDLRLPPARVLARAVGGVAALCGAAAYLALRPGGFVARNESVLTGGNELGNLLGPLRLRQIAGIWLSGDFRTAATSPTVTSLLIAVVVLAGATGLVLAVYRSRRELTLYLLCSLAGGLIVYWVSSPWLAGKALATASPAVVFAALIACAIALGGHATDAGGVDGALERGATTGAKRRDRLARRANLIPWRAVGALAGAAIVVGVVWSNLLGYHDVSLAPRGQFSELAHIGETIAGEGPTLITDYSPFGARHFLREAEAESASDLRTRFDPLLSDKPLAKATTADIDQFQTTPLLVYRTLVLRRSPVASRPPSPYTLRSRDRYWEVWQRPVTPTAAVLNHLPLGDAVRPGGVPTCATVLGLARTAGARELIAAPVENPLVVGVGEASSHPRRWSDGSEYLSLNGAGTARLIVAVPRAGRYELWLGGSMSGPVRIAINGVTLGTRRYETQEDGQYVPFGAIGLQRGRYEVRIGYDGGDWRPGSGGPPATVGPLVLRREAPPPPLQTVPVRAAASLCGLTLDWVEAVGG
jgi:hypothetical protein